MEPVEALSSPLSPKEQIELRELILAQMFEGRGESIRERVLVNVLFQLSIDAASEIPPRHMQPVGASEIGRQAMLFEGQGGARAAIEWDSQVNVNSLLSGIRSQLRVFFDKRKTTHRVELRTRPFTNVLDFPVNEIHQRKVISPDVGRFWQCYFGNRTAHLIYPEPQFFRDQKYSYVRSPDANSDRDVDKLAYLTPSGRSASDMWRPSHSFVPSGIMAGVVDLLDYFLRNKSSIKVKGQRTDGDIARANENVIVLATPGTIKDMEFVTAPWPAQMFRGKQANNQYGVNTVRYLDLTLRRRGEVPDEMQLDQANGDRPLVKRALITRRMSWRGTGVMTLICGHSRVVQECARILTGLEPRRLASLMAEFPAESAFDDDFQIVLKFTLQHIKEELDPVSVTPEWVYQADVIRSYPVQFEADETSR